MKLTIPILPETLDLIQKINNDVRPQIEENPTHFVIDLTDAAVDILSQNHIESLDEAWEYTVSVHVGYIEE